jgi:hypothetical protein
MRLTPENLEQLWYAKTLLEKSSLAAKIANVLSMPIEKSRRLLPAPASKVVNHSAKTALDRALQLAVTSLDYRTPRPSSNILHKIVVAGTGAGGGAFGLAGLPVELPISTVIMLRSIADIARSEGEMIISPESKLACVEVFALGGPSGSKDATEVGYFAVRAALQRVISDAAQYIAQRSAIQQRAPAILRLVTQIASRFSVVVSQKVTAQAVPVIGAAGGAAVNVLFIDHYQHIARGHFIVRRLERKYDSETVREAYEGL